MTELQAILERVRYLAPEELPQLLGELEVIRATAMLRLAAPVPVQPSDMLLDVDTAAARLGVSADYLYRHAKELPFTRRLGRKLLFSRAGLDAYLRGRQK